MGIRDLFAKKRRKVEVQPMVDHDLYILESQLVDSKRDIQNFIANRVDELLGSSAYYYGYIYDDGILTYYAAVSKSHDVGKLPVFAPAMVEKGRFILKRGTKVTIIDRDEDDLLTCDIGTGYHEGADLDDYTCETPMPETLKLKWSLARPHVDAMVICGVVLALAAFYFIWNTKAYENISSQTRMLSRQKAAPTSSGPNGLPDITGIIKDVAVKIGDQGSIRQVKYDQGKVAIFISYPDKDLARDFIRANGGDYVDGKVVLAWATEDPNSKPAAGKGGAK